MLVSSRKGVCVWTWERQFDTVAFCLLGRLRVISYVLCSCYRSVSVFVDMVYPFPLRVYLGVTVCRRADDSELMRVTVMFKAGNPKSSLWFYFCPFRHSSWFDCYSFRWDQRVELQCDDDDNHLWFYLTDGFGIHQMDHPMYKLISGLCYCEYYSH